MSKPVRADHSVLIPPPAPPRRPARRSVHPSSFQRGRSASPITPRSSTSHNTSTPSTPSHSAYRNNRSINNKSYHDYYKMPFNTTPHSNSSYSFLHPTPSKLETRCVEEFHFDLSPHEILKAASIIQNKSYTTWDNNDEKQLNLCKIVKFIRGDKGEEDFETFVENVNGGGEKRGHFLEKGGIDMSLYSTQGFSSICENYEDGKEHLDDTVTTGCKEHRRLDDENVKRSEYYRAMIKILESQKEMRDKLVQLNQVEAASRRIQLTKYGSVFEEIGDHGEMLVKFSKSDTLNEIEKEKKEENSKGANVTKLPCPIDKKKSIGKAFDNLEKTNSLLSSIKKEPVEAASIVQYLQSLYDKLNLEMDGSNESVDELKSAIRATTELVETLDSVKTLTNGGDKNKNNSLL